MGPPSRRPSSERLAEQLAGVMARDADTPLDRYLGQLELAGIDVQRGARSITDDPASRPTGLQRISCASSPRTPSCSLGTPSQCPPWDRTGASVPARASAHGSRPPRPERSRRACTAGSSRCSGRSPLSSRSSARRSGRTGYSVGGFPAVDCRSPARAPSPARSRSGDRAWGQLGTAGDRAALAVLSVHSDRLRKREAIFAGNLLGRLHPLHPRDTPRRSRWTHGEADHE